VKHGINVTGHSVFFSGYKQSRHLRFEASVGFAVGTVQVEEQKYMLLKFQNVVQSRGELVTTGFGFCRKLILPDFPMLISLFWRNYSI
jgi:hypothetical protein